MATMKSTATAILVIILSGACRWATGNLKQVAVTVCSGGRRVWMQSAFGADDARLDPGNKICWWHYSGSWDTAGKLIFVPQVHIAALHKCHHSWRTALLPKWCLVCGITGNDLSSERFDNWSIIVVRKCSFVLQEQNFSIFKYYEKNHERRRVDTLRKILHSKNLHSRPRTLAGKFFQGCDQAALSLKCQLHIKVMLVMICAFSLLLWPFLLQCCTNWMVTCSTLQNVSVRQASENVYKAMGHIRASFTSLEQDCLSKIWTSG